MSDNFGSRIAVVVPCHNEEATIASVVTAFAKALPTAMVFVYDNASTDNTSSVAREAGAIVRTEPVLGKGSVVRRMFADVEADVYVMADGDGTYDAAMAPVLVDRLIDEGLDMVIGTRRGVRVDAGRRGHAVGNRLFNTLYRLLFASSSADLFSGYRVFSRRFVKSFPAVSAGFEVETEISVHASQLQLPVSEVEVAYMARPDGSESKLRSVADGFGVLRAMIVLLKVNRPMALLGSFSALFATASFALGCPVVVDYLRTGVVERLPTAVLATGLAVLALTSAVAGLIMDSISRASVESRRLAYLAQPGPGDRLDG